jgi:hypothetical protein
MTEASNNRFSTFSSDDLKGIRDFIKDAEIVEGSDELYAIVSELWPDLLHKVKPPRGLMH